MSGQQAVTVGVYKFDWEARSAVFESGSGRSGAFESGSVAYIRSLFPYLCHVLFFAFLIGTNWRWLQAPLFDDLEELNDQQ